MTDARQRNCQRSMSRCLRFIARALGIDGVPESQAMAMLGLDRRDDREFYDSLKRDGWIRPSPDGRIPRRQIVYLLNEWGSRRHYSSGEISVEE